MRGATLPTRLSVRQQYFNPRSSCEERRLWPAGRASHVPFQSTLLMRGATPGRSRWRARKSLFQSTLLMRGATHLCHGSPCVRIEFQSTLLMRGATCRKGSCSGSLRGISIHAPHARSDDTLGDLLDHYGFQSTLLMRGATWSFLFASPETVISIHAPHARSDDLQQGKPATIDIFQSTLLMRGATNISDIFALTRPDFNPRSSCEERPLACRATGRNLSNFNPRSSCEERLDRDEMAVHIQQHFNPRSSCEERLGLRV